MPHWSHSLSSATFMLTPWKAIKPPVLAADAVMAAMDVVQALFHENHAAPA